MRFVCESCRAQYMINDEKVGPKGVKVRCRKCGYVIVVKRADASKGGGPVTQSNDPDDALATQVMQSPLSPADATLSNDDTQAEEMTSPGTSTSFVATSTCKSTPWTRRNRAARRSSGHEEEGNAITPSPSLAPSKHFICCQAQVR
jgi:predicted Zn finger-like uncharacterized protein